MNLTLHLHHAADRSEEEQGDGNTSGRGTPGEEDMGRPVIWERGAPRGSHLEQWPRGLGFRCGEVEDGQGGDI